MMLRCWGYVWAFPMTMAGLNLGILSVVTGGRIGFRRGVFEVTGGISGWFLKRGLFGHGGAAMTVGHVILARDTHCLQQSREHEHHHVRQYEHWGLFLPLAYLAVAAWLKLRGLDPYLDHPFEPPP